MAQECANRRESPWAQIRLQSRAAIARDYNIGMWMAGKSYERSRQRPRDKKLAEKILSNMNTPISTVSLGR